MKKTLKMKYGQEIIELPEKEFRGFCEMADRMAMTHFQSCSNFPQELSRTLGEIYIMGFLHANDAAREKANANS
jgi:hypothetical protein